MNIAAAELVVLKEGSKKWYVNATGIWFNQK